MPFRGFSPWSPSSAASGSVLKHSIMMGLCGKVICFMVSKGKGQRGRKGKGGEGGKGRLGIK